jgi:hypothetical protein
MIKETRTLIHLRGNLSGRLKEETALHCKPDHTHELAFYLGLNAALVTVIVAAISWPWPLQ